jgi:hypothetical protein
MVERERKQVVWSSITDSSGGLSKNLYIKAILEFDLQNGDVGDWVWQKRYGSRSTFIAKFYLDLCYLALKEDRTFGAEKTLERII